MPKSNKKSVHFQNLADKRWKQYCPEKNNDPRRAGENSVPNQNEPNELPKQSFQIDKKVEEIPKNVNIDIIYQGVLWTCSHTLYIDSELEKELHDLRERPLCYKNYMLLWNSLLKAERSDKKTLHQFFNELMLTLLTLMNKLNLHSKIMDNVTYFDASISMIAENEDDFRVFVNLVDFYVDLIEEVESFLLTEWVERLLFDIVKHSYNHPMVSGFYRLVNVILRISQVFTENSIESPSNQLCDLISQYFTGILNKVCVVSNELQRVCIYTILETPLYFVPNILINTVPVFKIAFNIGLTELELAFRAFETLELWNQKFGNRSIHLIREVIPCLDLYLQSESSIKFSNDTSTSVRRNRTVLINDDRSRETLQRRIMIFFGTLDSKTLHHTIHGKCFRNTEGTWNKKDLVVYELMFADIRLKIYLDNLLPRVVELATSSDDEQTKVTACEVLHSIIAVILGKKLSDQCLDKNICSALLKLGCDANQIVRQLYHPLILQMTHWFSSKCMLESRVTQYFLDSFFEGLTSDSTLRDYSGFCLGEFTEWSLRQSSDDDLLRSPVNIRTTIRRITNLALHPSNKNRIAAAVAFNHLYAILRENEDIVNIYWLEFLQVFVKSLDGCNDIRIIEALGHVEKVIKFKATLFNTKSKSRRKPLYFTDETLQSAVMWLFTKCGSLDETCRKTSMQLVENLSPNVTDWYSVADLISTILNNDGVYKMHSIILENLEENPEQISREYVLILLRVLHEYTWLFQKDLTYTEVMFGKSDKSNYIFNSLNKFFKLLTAFETEMDYGQNEVVVSQESEEMNTLKCSAILRVFQFIESLLKAPIRNEVHIPESLWDNDLFKLICNCTLNPYSVGFTAKNLQITVELPQQMENLLKLMKSKLPDALLKKLFTIFSNFVECEFNSMNITWVINDNPSTKSKEILNGLKLLRRCQLLDLVEMGTLIVQNFSEKINDIFTHVHYDTSNDSGFFLMPKVKEYLENVLELLFEVYQPEMINTVINHMVCNASESNTAIISTIRGSNFYNEFKDVIFKAMLRNIHESMNILDNVMWRYPDEILTLMEELCIYAQRFKFDYSEMLADEIIHRCVSLRNAVNNLEHRKKKFININQAVVCMKSNPVEISTKRTELYFWILEEYNLSKDLNAKTEILQAFLVCLTDETSDINSELRIILHQLRDNDSLSWSCELASSEMKRLEASNCLQTLLAILPTTKSVVVWQSSIKFAAGGCRHIFDEKMKDYLNLYFVSISDINAAKSLETAYQLFMNLNAVEERFDVLLKFLLPALDFCKSLSIDEFYLKYLEEISSYVLLDINNRGKHMDRRKFIISKMGCFNLLEVMFAKMECEKIENLKVNGGKPLKPEVFKSALQLRTFKPNCEEENEIVRLLHCAAYNCSIAIVSLKTEEKFYKYLFPKILPTKKSIWENIVDCNKRYGFEQGLKEFPKQHKKLINIRSSIVKQMNCGSKVASFTHRYNLASSTLTEDVHAYDLNMMKILKRNQSSDTQDERMNLDFEEGDFNEHECMGMITAMIIHMFSTEIIHLPNLGDAVELPQWMQSFRDSFSIDIDNVTLFLMKIICNTKNVFLPYVQSFLAPLAESINRYLKKNTLNYIINDILIILIETKAVPSNEAEIKATQALIEGLIEKAHSDTKHIYRYNVEIIETLIKYWNEQLKVPSSLHKRIIPGDDFDEDYGANLILILLKNNMEQDLILNDDIFMFLFNSIDNWKAEESLVFQKFEAIGWFLNFSAPIRQFEDKIEKINNKLTKVFTDMQTYNSDRLVGCIHAASKGNSKIAVDFLVFTQNNISKVSDSNKAKCLEVLLICIPNIEKDQLIKELGYSRLKIFLQNKVLSCEMIGLKIVATLVNILSPRDLLPWIKLVMPFSKNDFFEYRKIAYEIYVCVHKKYHDVSNDTDINELVNLSRNILIAGLLDSSKEIYERVLKFWSDDTQLPEICRDRLLSVLRIYSPNIQEHFLPFMCLIILDQTRKSPDYEEIMFRPLSEGSFREYQIALNWRRNNLASMAPLFVPSLASQMNRVFTQSGHSLQASTFTMPTNYMELQATQDFEFEVTLPEEDYTYKRLNLDLKKIPDPANNKLSKRTTYNRDSTSVDIRRPIHKQQIKIYRKYKVGDFPFVEISHATVIDPLMELVKKDWLICKNIVVSLICNVIDRTKKRTFSDEIFNIFTYLLQNHTGMNTIVPTILEIMLKLKNVDGIDNGVLAKVTKSMDLYSLGILLLEEKLIKNNFISDNQPLLEPPLKKIHIGNDQNIDWVYLANLYKCIGEDDVTLSIFKKPTFSRSLQEASFAQAASNWVMGKRFYENAYEEEDGSIKEHCFTGLLECMNQLSLWNDIDERIAKKLDKDYDSIWNNAQKDDLITWLFRAQTQKMIENTTAKSVDDSTLKFKQVLEKWISERGPIMKQDFGEELAMFFLSDNVQIARQYLKCGLNAAREQWIHLSEKLREHKLVKLRGLSNIEQYLKAIESSDFIEGVQNLIQYWERHVPALGDDLALWNVHVSYRLFFSQLLQQRLNNQIDNDPNIVSLQLIAIDIRQRMKIINISIERYNKSISKKHILKIERLLQNDVVNNFIKQNSKEREELEHQFDFICSKYWFLCGELENDKQKKLSQYAKSWEKSCQILKKDSLNSGLKVEVTRQLCDTIVTFRNFVMNDFEFRELITRNTFITSEIETNSQNDIGEILDEYSYSILKNCCETTTMQYLGESFFQLAKYCYNIICKSINQYSHVQEEFIKSTLKAMVYGSRESTSYFPCLLKFEYYENNDSAKQTFIQLSKEVPSWLFLSWQAQILSHLGTSIAELVIPIVRRLVMEYSNAVMYNFRLIIETKPFLRGDPVVNEMCHVLFDRPGVKTFLTTMGFVVQPETYLKHYIERLDNNLMSTKPITFESEVNSLISKVFHDDDPLKGPIYKSILRYKSSLQNIAKSGSNEKLKFILHELKSKKVPPSKFRRLSVGSLLKEYSPHLHAFSGEQIEIPGQYVGDRKPMVRYHTTIARFEPNVRVMESKTKPIKITMIGNDGKNYSFLAKFGEDLRLDQRLQQFFSIANKTLESNVACSQRYLSIDTYQIVPFSTCFGLIQWVDGTRSMKEFIEFSLNDKDVLGKMEKYYERWINTGLLSKPRAVSYKEALIKYSAVQVITKMKEIMKNLEWDCLKKTFVSISPSYESFVSLRRNFITTYATMCITHWIVGVGDRHLENTLITVKSGRCLGIDFGTAFGTGVDLCIPELMPFRLTPQILGLLKPFSEHDLIGTTMIHALRALRSEKGTLMACLDVFVNEELNWTENINKFAEIASNSKIDTTSFPKKKKISIVEKKLNGIKPSIITIQELSNAHNDKYMPLYTAIVNGTDTTHSTLRATITKIQLSLEEQVMCLIDQATDLNILGRTWQGWSPYI